mgnify:CR=1 FL=1
MRTLKTRSFVVVLLVVALANFFAAFSTELGL